MTSFNLFITYCFVFQTAFTNLEFIKLTYVCVVVNNDCQIDRYKEEGSTEELSPDIWQRSHCLLLISRGGFSLQIMVLFLGKNA